MNTGNTVPIVDFSQTTLSINGILDQVVLDADYFFQKNNLSLPAEALIYLLYTQPNFI